MRNSTTTRRRRLRATQLVRRCAVVGVIALWFVDATVDTGTEADDFLAEAQAVSE